VNDIIWRRFSSTGSSKSISNKFPVNHDNLYWYSRTNTYKYKKQYLEYSEKYLSRFKNDDDDGRGKYRISDLKSYSEKTLQRLKIENKLIEPQSPGSHYSYKRYFSELKGIVLDDVWVDIFAINPMAGEKLNYPTQKPEELIARIINSLSSQNDIVLDSFAGSGTTLAVAEKLGRRWIGMDCGKLAIYTIQKRMLELTTRIGSPQKDERPEHGRVDDFAEHLKSKSKGLLIISEKTRQGELVVTDALLEKLADFLTLYLPGKGEKEFSLICPENNFKVFKVKITEPEDEKAGEKIVRVNGIKFLISFIQPKEKPEKEKPLRAKQFTLYNAGVYDEQAILNLPWEQYRGFVLKLFDVREMRHQIHGTVVDGYIGLHSALIWNYPEKKNLRLDHEYVESLHNVLGGKAGSRFYVIAPVVAMSFMEDEYRVGDTTYIFLKVPLSVLMALIKKGEAGSLKQPVKEADVNEVIDAVGFDFISQPVVKAKYRRAIPSDLRLFNAEQKDYIIELTEFRSNTLVYDPEDFENFETLSMVLVDANYNGDVFRMSHVFWRDKIYMEDKQKAVLKIPEPEFPGDKMMIIMMDRYGNELKIVKSKADFK